MTAYRLRSIAAPILAFACMLCLAGMNPAAADYIDSINPNAVVEPNTIVSSPLSDFGWYYTPTQSYELTGISSFFEPINFGTGSRTMTFQIQTDRPVNGGTVLGQGTTVGNSATGGVIGVTFSPVFLTAGTTYFVDILNLTGMGLDLGQWTNVNGVDVASGGATTRLPAYYVNHIGDTSFSTTHIGDSADESNANGTASGLEPILYFSGFKPSAVPEPSSILLLGIGIAGFARAVGRGRSK